MHALQVCPRQRHPSLSAGAVAFTADHHRQRPRHRGGWRHHHRQPRTHRRVAVAAGPDGVQLAVWDVVEYAVEQRQEEQQQQQLRLGLVQQVLPDAVHLSPLVEEDPDVWTPEAEDPESPEQQQRVLLSQVLRTVDAAYGQRQDKHHNPHGEHAHDVWQVLAPLSAGVWRGEGSSGSSGSSAAAGSSVRAEQT